MEYDYDYNTNRNKLILPEYGRNIQKMISHICTIEDRDERNKAARTIIGIMGNLNPHLRDVGDFKHKLWDHLAIISDFKLDIESPYEIPEPSKFQEKPNKIAYNQNRLKYKHYGKSVELMIGSANEGLQPDIFGEYVLLDEWDIEILSEVGPSGWSPFTHLHDRYASTGKVLSENCSRNSGPTI